MIEQPNRNAYDDPDLKDVVGELPRLFCVATTPPRELLPSESMRCLACDAPCWDSKRLKAPTSADQR